jgi:hypothetical protein
MAARLAIGSDARERLRRLAVVFAVEIRLKIVVELYMREMSALQFYEMFGGGSSTRITQNFNILEKEGWLRFIYRKGPGGDRRGAVENFYRATEPPLIDAEGWALLPYSVRVTSSWNLFKQIAPRLRADLEVSSKFDQFRRDLSCTTFLLDEQAWRRSIAAFDAQFIGLFEEQEDARRRVGVSGEELIPADVFLVGFQSPNGAQPTAGERLLEHPREPLIGFQERLAPILKDDVLLEIITVLNKQEISVTQFHREFGGASKPGISRRFKMLESSGWVGKGVRKTGGSRRGAREQFYRASKPMLDGYDPCTDAPKRLAATKSWKTFERLCTSIKAAMAAGTLDARPDRYLTWSLISLDRQGWESIIAGIESLAEFISHEQEQAKIRMAKSGEKPIRMTIGLAAHEALKDAVKAP